MRRAAAWFSADKPCDWEQRIREMLLQDCACFSKLLEGALVWTLSSSFFSRLALKMNIVFTGAEPTLGGMVLKGVAEYAALASWSF